MWTAVILLIVASVVAALGFLFVGLVWIWVLAAVLTVAGIAFWIHAGTGSTATTSQHPVSHEGEVQTPVRRTGRREHSHEGNRS